MNKMNAILIAALVVFLAQPLWSEEASKDAQPQKNIPAAIAPFFNPPPEYAHDLGSYKSPLNFFDGTPVKTREDWRRRREEILKTWHGIMGAWPPLIEKPKIEYLSQERRENFMQHKIRLEVAAGPVMFDSYLLIPDGDGPFPAALVLYYEADTAIGKGREERDFALQLAKRGFVTLSTGTPASFYYPNEEKAALQPLSAMAYAAANAYNALANLPQVDPQRIGVLGHSYGGKWAMFASCLYEKFACAAWSDGGVVFDETRPNVNYWDRWYLGYESGHQRQEGMVTKENPRTGAYKQLMEEGHDLIELHALMAPRPFLVSGGSEDRPERWKALNHAVAVNEFLGYKNRVAMTTREGHSPTVESNEQMYEFLEYFLKNNK